MFENSVVCILRNAFNELYIVTLKVSVSGVWFLFLCFKSRWYGIRYVSTDRIQFSMVTLCVTRVV